MGANDGILSTASLIVGVAAGAADHVTILLAGIAGMTAGALSMAAGEYVSVSSQEDVEQADIAKERRELKHHPEAELDELTAIYETRGLPPPLAREVAEHLTEADALGAHLRDEIGLTDLSPPRPLQAALVSALTFAAGASIPLAVGRRPRSTAFRSGSRERPCWPLGRWGRSGLRPEAPRAEGARSGSWSGASWLWP